MGGGNKIKGFYKWRGEFWEEVEVGKAVLMTTMKDSQVARKACELFCRNSRNTRVCVAVCMGKSTILNRIFKNEIKFLTRMFS